MDDLFEAVLKPLIRLVVLLLRAVIWLFWELWFEIIAWYVGWPVVRALTLWRFPREGINEHAEARTLTVVMVGCVGIVVLFGAVIALTPLVEGRT